MNRILDQYIFKKFISSLLIALTAFIIIFLIVSIIDFLDKFIEYNLTSKEILLYYIYTIPWFINIALPMSLLISTIFTLGNLQKNNEITAIKASGVSVRRAGLSILISGFIFSFFLFFFENTIVVNAIQKRYEIDKKLKPLSKKYIKNRKNNIYYHLNDSFIEIKKFNYKNNTGYNISLQNYNNSDLSHRIDAKKMIWEESSNSWELQQCQIRKWNNNSLIFRSINDTTISIEDVTPEIIKKDFVKPEEMDYWELSDFIHKLENKGLSTNRWLVNKYYKTAFACIPLIMIVFGLGLSIQKPRSSHALGIGFSIIVIFMYYALITFAKTLGYNNILPPIISVWSINFMFLSIGTFIYLKART